MPKSQNNNPITRKELRKELTEFTDEVLLPGMEKTFTTKDELDKKLDNKFNKFKEETIGGVDKLLTKADKVCKDLDTLLKEEKAGTALYKRHDKKLENHEKRIKKLESEFAFD